MRPAGGLRRPGGDPGGRELAHRAGNRSIGPRIGPEGRE